MSFPHFRVPARLSLMIAATGLFLTACNQRADFDMRGLSGGFSTADAAQAPVANRPLPDSRGVISYPSYQVAVAQRGDTLRSVATRLGLDPLTLATFNGIDPDVTLRKDEVIALPGRVSEPSPATGALGTGPIQPVDINRLAGGAIDRAPATPGVQTAALPPATPTAPRAQTGKEPVRHKVERGETAFTISRLYAVPVKALAEWNGLGADFAIREGQFLLIPVPQQNPPRQIEAAATAPGVGSPTPTPPSATKPLPSDVTAKPLPVAETPKPVVDVGPTTKPAATGKLVRPVDGTIIREYAKGRNEGINIKASAGSPVKAAEAGTVAAITQSADGVPIVVLRHPDNLLTVYANVTGLSVAKGDTVARGQQIAKLRDGDDAYVHFEVRQGFDSVDPGPFLN